LRPDWSDKVRQMISDHGTLDDELLGNDGTLPRGLAHHFALTGAWILIAPLMAIERGHNIINADGSAAIGAAFFLVRPHPRPDDLGFAIHSINRWAMDRGFGSTLSSSPADMLQLGAKFRAMANQRWRHLLEMPMMHQRLPDEELEALTWSNLVT